MCKAEKKCRKLHMGAVPWSPAIQEVRTKIYYLKLCRKQRTKVKVSRKLLMRQAKKSKLYCEHIPIKEIDALEICPYAATPCALPISSIGDWRDE